MSRQDANAAFARTSFLWGGNAGYVEDLYARHQADPAAVDAQWREFFQGLKDERADVTRSARAPSWRRRDWPQRPRSELVAALDGDWREIERAVGERVAARAQAKGAELSATHVQQATRDYPSRLREAVIGRLWEASFSLDNARKALTRADCAHVAGCLFRVVLLCAHALHANAGRWLVNEEGAMASAGRLPNAPAGFSQRAQSLCAHIGLTETELDDTLAAAQDLLDATQAACTSS